MKLFELLSWTGMPFRTVTGEGPHERDTPPERTASGDFVFYHGTSGPRALKIVEEKRITHDDLGYCGVGTTVESVGTYAVIKAMKERKTKLVRGKMPRVDAAVLRVIVAQKWFDEHPDSVMRETGGSGRNQFLIKTKELPLVDAKIIRRRGQNIR